ncbi:hypothetical protein OsJ_22535 [Oryza sativa Japonica Group]|uniref:Uncharacterized protein n=1 Tax=Oryza sativa subsp. japonica TaxID=39947 RepID=B9FQR2_ORYSJ|nr:hypothetical protein OsJ_22535 [Oryza sativa Japonica Group]
MGVYTFVCRSSGDEWTAKQLKGELEASAATPYELQRCLVAAASAADSAAGVQSSFSMVSPSSAVFQVCLFPLPSHRALALCSPPPKSSLRGSCFRSNCMLALV